VSKTNDQLLLFPGESGWEIWTAQPGAEFSLHSATGTLRASDVSPLPPGDLTMLFPVKAITAIPMRVASEDQSLFPDLAALHAERLGLRPDPMAGQLTDQFIIATEGEETSLLSVILRTPGDGDLPTRSPNEFDLSARALPLDGSRLTVWKELGRWVFSISHQGHLVYCQATALTSPVPDDSLVREIRLALIQLSLQGIELTPERVHFHTASESPDPGALDRAFGVPVLSEPRPAPVLPAVRSKLLPADVRAARREARRRRTIQLAAAAVVLFYLGVIGWFGFGLWKDTSETKKLLAAAAAAEPEGIAYSDHVAKWDELAPAIDLNKAPVDILYRIARSIPPNSGLRLRTAEISATNITLTGEAPQLPSTNQFSLALTKSNDLAAFTWSNPAAQQSNRGWEFNFTGAIPTASQP
jgi:hypothetical protein